MCAYGICLYTIYEMIDSNDTRHGKGNLGLFCYSKVITLLHSEHQDSKHTHRKQCMYIQQQMYNQIVRKKKELRQWSGSNIKKKEDI